MAKRPATPARSPIGSACYSDGSPVVFGPFGGDQPTEAEKRMLQHLDEEARARRWWQGASLPRAVFCLLFGHKAREGMWPGSCRTCRRYYAMPGKVRW